MTWVTTALELVGLAALTAAAGLAFGWAAAVAAFGAAALVTSWRIERP